MKTVMKPNLYAGLDMIPEIGTNGSIQRLKRYSKGLLHHKLVQKWSKRISNGTNYKKGGKNFQNFEKFL